MCMCFYMFSTRVRPLGRISMLLDILNICTVIYRIVVFANNLYQNMDTLLFSSVGEGRNLN